MEFLTKVLDVLPVRIVVNLAAAAAVMLMIAAAARDASHSVLEFVSLGMSHVNVTATAVNDVHRELTGERWQWALAATLVLGVLGTGFGVATGLHFHSALAPSLSWGTYIATFSAAIATDIAGTWGLAASAAMMLVVGMVGARAGEEPSAFVLGFSPIYLPFAVLCQAARPLLRPRIDDVYRGQS